MLVVIIIQASCLTYIQPQTDAALHSASTISFNITFNISYFMREKNVETKKAKQGWTSWNMGLDPLQNMIIIVLTF